MSKNRFFTVLSVFGLLAILFAWQGLAGATPTSAGALAPVTFAVIGDYAMDNTAELNVANMVKSWNPAFVITTGDDYYTPAGGTGSTKYDESTGAYYCAYLKDITTTGTHCPTGPAAKNKFFPSLGNHDYSDAGTVDGLPATYTDYFTLPGAGYTNTSGNERYYDFVYGDVHFFVVNSSALTGEEPDGTSSTSVQAQWLQAQLAASTSIWNIVYFHYPPYSSGKHGSNKFMQWPFALWGADAVLGGHDHLYERILLDGIVYMVNGSGGGGLYEFHTPITGSVSRYNADYGAQKVIVTQTSITFEFYSVAGGGTKIDTYTITKEKQTLKPQSAAVYDGWILESSETSNRGGRVNRAAKTFQIGDDALDRQYKAILSFDTASLPDNAVILSAMLQIKQSGAVVGSNPFKILGALRADICKGSFGAIGLSASDFQAAPSAGNAVTFKITPAAGWYSATLKQTGRDNINKIGVTQFRLYFTRGDNDDRGADFMKFFSGNAASGRPLLIITYIAP